MKAKLGPAFLLLLIVSILALTSCAASSKNVSEEDASQVTRQQITVSAFEAYDMAMAEVAHKYDNIYLQEITAGGGTVGASTLAEKVNVNGEASKWDVWFKHLLAEVDTYEHIIVTVDNGIVVKMWTSEPSTLDFDYIMENAIFDIERCKIPGSEAVRIADGDGGSDYTRIMLKLCNGSAGCPHWIVAYGPGTSEEGEHPGVTFHIDGETGDIVGKEMKMYTVF